MAAARPAQLPVYLANCGFDAWKRILTRSSGATTVFAWHPSPDQRDVLNDAQKKVPCTYRTTRQSASETTAQDIIQTPCLHLLGSPAILPLLHTGTMGNLPVRATRNGPRRRSRMCDPTHRRVRLRTRLRNDAKIRLRMIWKPSGHEKEERALVWRPRRTGKRVWGVRVAPLVITRR